MRRLVDRRAVRIAGAGRRSLHRWFVALLVILLGGAALVGGARWFTPGGSGYLAARTTGSTIRPAGLERGRPTDVLARSAPVFLVVPAIGLSTKLSRLGLNADGTVEVPTDPNEPGWFHLGPTPGQLGSSVLLGHVDSRTGPAVFFHLRQLSPGDEVIVVLADHLRERFTVRSVSTYDKARFPARRVYGATSHRSLNLVTCGGAFDSATGSYVANVVVTTRLTSTEPVIDGLGLSEPTRAGVASRRSGS